MIISIEKRPNGEFYLPFPNEIIDKFDINLGDKIELLERNNGSVALIVF